MRRNRKKKQEHLELHGEAAVDVVRAEIELLRQAGDDSVLEY